MWTLWIVSTIIGLEEPKHTVYDTYETKMACQIEWHIVNMYFTENEIAYCERTNE